jgi:hypothetical protein
MRDDFTTAVKELLAKRVGYKCGNPECRQPTSGPQEDPAKAVNIGVAAHITAASPDGPRFDDSLTRGERRSAENGIWLCQNHGKLVDNDALRFSVGLLNEWKRISEEMSRRELVAPRSLASSQDDARGAAPVVTWQWDDKAGVWLNQGTGFRYCANCKAEGKSSPLKTEQHGYRCNVCGQYTNDPTRPRAEPVFTPPIKGPNGWMAN